MRNGQNTHLTRRMVLLLFKICITSSNRQKKIFVEFQINLRDHQSRLECEWSQCSQNEQWTIETSNKQNEIG